MVNPRFVIKAVLSGQRLNINVPLTVAGTVNYIGVEAKCTSEWDDCTVVCYLYQAGTGYTAQLGLIYDTERKLYYYPNAERLTLTAGEWAVWFVGVVAESGQEKYKITSETRVFTVYEYPFASSIPPGDISLDEEAIARATDAQNKANLLLDKYNAGELTGPKGDPGDPAHIGFVQASVDNTTINPSCEVTVTESPDNTYNMQFDFSGIKGEKGDTGATGPKGDTGPQGAPGRDGRDGEDGQTIDDYVLVQAEQPTSETNKMWLKPTASGDPIMIPSAEEFQAIETNVNNLNNEITLFIPNDNDEERTYRSGEREHEYTEYVSITWRSIKVPVTEGEKIRCKFNPSRTTLQDWVLFVTSNNIIIDKISERYTSREAQTLLLTCPANSAYVIVNSYVNGLSEYALSVDTIVRGTSYLQDEIEIIQETVSLSNGMIGKGEILLPTNIYVAVNRQCNLNWSSISNYQEGSNSVYFEVICDIGRNCERGYTLDAQTADVGTHPIKINCRDAYSRIILSTYTGNVIVVEPAVLSNSVNVLMIGDSRTTLSSNGTQGVSLNEINGRMITTTVKELADAAYSGNVQFIGTKSSVTDPTVKNLAESGWTVNNVITEITKAGGIRNYIEVSCGLGSGASLDFVTIMLGINDIGPWSGNDENKYITAINKIDGYITRLKTLINEITTAYPACKVIVVCESTSCANQDSFGYFSGANYRRTSEGEMEQALKVLRKRVLAEFDNSAYNANVIVSSAGLWCDRLYGFPYIVEHPESRISVKTVDRFVNFIHPHDDGYKQIADGIFSTLVELI